MRSPIDAALHVNRGPGGNAIFTDPHSSTTLYWNGPGATIRLMFCGNPVSIDSAAPSDTLADARREAVAFLERVHRQMDAYR